MRSCSCFALQSCQHRYDDLNIMTKEFKRRRFVTFLSHLKTPVCPKTYSVTKTPTLETPSSNVKWTSSHRTPHSLNDSALPLLKNCLLLIRRLRVWDHVEYPSCKALCTSCYYGNDKNECTDINLLFSCQGHCYGKVDSVLRSVLIYLFIFWSHLCSVCGIPVISAHVLEKRPENRLPRKGRDESWQPLNHDMWLFQVNSELQPLNCTTKSTQK